MTTRAIVPNGDGEGSLGTVSAKWGAIYSSDPASGENSGQVPTTAWVQKLLADALAKQKTAYEQAISTAVTAAKTQAKLDAHPVGSYYWSNDSTSPATLFGGTWEALPAGYTLIAQGSGSDSFGSFTYTAGTKYGERMHKLTTDELAKHTVTTHFKTGFNSYCMGEPWNGNGASNSWTNTVNTPAGSGTGTAFNQTIEMDLTSNPVGGDAAHNNIPPVVAAYVWLRTA